jgi:hypothetical protein
VEPQVKQMEQQREDVKRWRETEQSRQLAQEVARMNVDREELEEWETAESNEHKHNNSLWSSKKEKRREEKRERKREKKEAREKEKLQEQKAKESGSGRHTPALTRVLPFCLLSETFSFNSLAGSLPGGTYQGHQETAEGARRHLGLLAQVRRLRPPAPSSFLAKPLITTSSRSFLSAAGQAEATEESWPVNWRSR